MDEENQLFQASLKLLAKTSLFVSLGFVLSKIMSYIYRIAVARAFGAEDYGAFSLALMIATLGIAIASFGLPEGLVRYIAFYRGAKDIASIRYTVKNVLIFLLISSSILSLLLFMFSDMIAVSFFKDLRLSLFLKLLSFFIPIAIFSNAFLSIIRAFEKINWYSFINNIFGNGVRIGVFFALVLWGVGNSSIIVSYGLGWLAIGIFSFVVWKQAIPESFGESGIGKEKKRKIVKEVYAYSWPLMFFASLSSIFYWMDSLALGYFKGVAEVGFYNAAVPIAFIFNIAPEIFIQLFFPMVSKEFSRKNFHVVKELSKQVGKWIFILNVPLFVLIFLYPGAFINILFGPEYIVAANALRILMVGTFVSSLLIISSNLLSMIGKSKLILFNIIAASLLNFVLNAVLIPRYGLEGAATATTISLIALNIALLFEARHYTSIVPLRRKLLRVVLVSSLPTVVLVFVKQFIHLSLFTMILQGLLFLFLYIFLIIMTGCLDKNDLAVLEGIKRAYHKRRFAKRVNPEE